MINVAIRSNRSCLSFKCIDLQELHCILSAPSDLELNQYFYCCDSLKEKMWNLKSTQEPSRNGKEDLNRKKKNTNKGGTQGEIFTWMCLWICRTVHSYHLSHTHHVNCRQLVTCECALPDVKCAFLCGAEWCRAGTDAAGHHLFPQIMYLCLETTVLYTHTGGKILDLTNS